MPKLADGEYAEPEQPASPFSTSPPARMAIVGARPGLTEIHPDEVESTAKLFEDSAQELGYVIRAGQTKLRMRPMADDDVSKQAAEGFTKAALDGPTSHIEALTGYREWLQGIADGIRASATRYRQAEDAIADVMRGGTGG